MTNGIVSVLIGGKVIVKVVAGCDGYNAWPLAEKILSTRLIDPDDVYILAGECGLGCDDCLVVQSEEPDNWTTIFYGDGDLGPLYREKFSDPKFNPRWECGLCAYTYVVDLDKGTIEGPKEED